MNSELPINIFCKIANSGYTECRSFVTEISGEQLATFNKVPPSRSYRLHNHDYEEPEFDKLENVDDLGSSDPALMRLMVRVNSFVYGYKFGGIMVRLNLDDLGGKWECIIPPASPYRWEPKLISLRGKLYVFGGIPTTLNVKIDYDVEPFGEVYDPEFDHWSTLVAPPQASMLNRCFDGLFVASLGETEGKILVYSPIDEDSVIYIYDVETQDWETHSGSVLDSSSVTNRIISRSEVINEDDHMLYWLDSRTAFIYAFDWRKQHLYSGPIIGLECDHNFKTMIHVNRFVSLHHLSHDLFYLTWPISNWGQQFDVKTELHFTILRVIKHTSIRALDAFVVGCLEHTISGSYRSFDAVHI